MAAQFGHMDVISTLLLNSDALAENGQLSSAETKCADVEPGVSKRAGCEDGKGAGVEAGDAGDPDSEDLGQFERPLAAGFFPAGQRQHHGQE